MEKYINSINQFLEPINRFFIKSQKYFSHFFLILSGGTIFLLGNYELMKFSGEQALNILWFLLILPIFARVLGIKIAQSIMPLRKEIGILMGMLALVHSVQYFLPSSGYIPNFSLLGYSSFWMYNGMITSVGIGVFSVIISSILLLTSNKISMKIFGKNWKRVHRTVYILLIFTLLHKILLGWERKGEIDYGEFALLIGYFSLKILEWKGVNLAKKSYPKGQKWICPPCGFIYDPAIGDADSGILPGTEFSDIPDSWRCPVCGVGKADFLPYIKENKNNGLIRSVIEELIYLNPTTIRLVLNLEKECITKPGQFMTFSLSDSDGDFSRSYSIADNTNGKLTFLIKLSEFGRAGKMLRTLDKGKTMYVHGAHGAFIVNENPLPKIFIATGTGLAPIVAMLNSLPENMRKVLYFSVSKKDDVFYTDELKSIPGIELHIHVTKEQVEGYETGRVDIQGILPDDKETEWYICGNPTMVSEATKKLQENGFSHIYSEEFSV